jgi:hypothetical protein
VSADKHREAHEAPLSQARPAHLGLGFGYPLHIIDWCFAWNRGFVEIGGAPAPFAQEQDLEAHADLLEQLPAPGTSGGEIDAAVE